LVIKKKILSKKYKFLQQNLGYANAKQSYDIRTYTLFGFIILTYSYIFVLFFESFPIGHIFIAYIAETNCST